MIRNTDYMRDVMAHLAFLETEDGTLLLTPCTGAETILEGRTEL